MKTLASIRYYMRDNLTAMAIYYGIILASYGLFSIAFLKADGANVSFGGMDFSSVVFMLVIGLNAFRQPFRLFLQNGVSRRTAFAGFAVSGLILSVLMSALDTVSSYLASLAYPYHSAFEQLYSGRYDLVSPLLAIPEGFLWRIALYLFIVMIGYLIAALYYRMDKVLKVAVSIGVPVFFVVLLPILDYQLTGGVIFSALFQFLTLVFGFQNGVNPYIPVLFFMLFTLVTGSLSYLALRRAVLRD